MHSTTAVTLLWNKRLRKDRDQAPSFWEALDAGLARALWPLPVLGGAGVRVDGGGARTAARSELVLRAHRWRDATRGGISCLANLFGPVNGLPLILALIIQKLVE